MLGFILFAQLQKKANTIFLKLANRKRQTPFEQLCVASIRHGGLEKGAPGLFILGLVRSGTQGTAAIHGAEHLSKLYLGS